MAASRVDPFDLTGLVVGRYLRISKDGEHDAKGVGRQNEDEVSAIKSAGGIVGPEYDENDTGAYKKKRIRLADGTVIYRVIRPVWQRMLEDLRSGAVEAAIVYDLDRLARDPRDLEDAIEIVEHYRRPIIGVTGSFDLVTDNGRFAARILVAQANKSSADTARRVARKHVQQQQEGVPTGGRRPFGWKADKRTLEPVEAEELKKAVERVTTGWPLSAVVADWNARGVKPVQSDRWVQSSVVGMMRNPRLCGWRGRGVKNFNAETGVTQTTVEVVRTPDGEPVKGQWEALISPAEWEAVNAVITSKARSLFPTPRPHGHNAWKYLLSGLARCGECGKPLRGMSTASRKKGNWASFVYACASTAMGGCGRIARQGPKTDLHVVEAVLSKVELELTDATTETGPWAREAELTEVQEDIAALTAAWKSVPKKISSGRYFGLLPDLENRERELTAERGRYTAAVSAVRNRPADIRAEWSSYPLRRQRSIIEEEVSAVIVHRAARRGAPFDPDLLEPVWRTD